MIRLEWMQALVATVECGSVTGAARRLALSKSVVSDRLSDLERTLGVRLLHRTTRSLQLTEDGTSFCDNARRILRDVEQATSALVERRGTLDGRLRISAPVSFGSLHLGPAVFAFLAGNPGVELSLELEDRFVDILADGYDAVIRHGPVDDKRIIVKRLAASRRLLVASPAYLKRQGTPTTLVELATHGGILYSNRGAADWRFRSGRRDAIVQPRVALRVNNGLIMRDAAIAGVGIALLPTFLLEHPLKTQALQVIDTGAEAEGATVYIAYPEHLRSSAKIRALTSSLRQAFGKPAYWDQAQPI